MRLTDVKVLRPLHFVIRQSALLRSKSSVYQTPRPTAAAAAWFGHIYHDADDSFREQQHTGLLLKLWVLVLQRIKTRYRYFLTREITVYPSIQDAWLSGFTQGDGGINMSRRYKTRTGYRVRLRDYLDQK